MDYEDQDERPPARYTVITSEVPERLTKRFFLDAGNLHKEPGAGVIVKGRCDVFTVDTIQEFADDVLGHLKDDEALVYGAPVKHPVDIVTKAVWEATGRPSEAIPRNREHFFWKVGHPAVMMCDYDPEPGEKPMTDVELVAAIREAVPGLADVEMVTYPSASSYIFNGETGAMMKGPGGLRVYFLVESGQDIPRAGRAICDRLWLAERGHITIGKSGAMLERTILDGLVWQPERLDFAAGASCEAPLRQDRGEPVFHEGSKTHADTEEAIPDLSDREVTRLEKLKAQARQLMTSAADKAKLEYRKAYARKKVGPTAERDKPDEFRVAMEEAKVAIERGVLWRDWPLAVQVGDEIVDVTVGEVLDNPKTYDGCLCRDPLEPDYDGGRLVGRLFPHTRRLDSKARGERLFEMLSQSREITMWPGALSEPVDKTVEVMREQKTFYDYGDVLAIVSRDGRIRSISKPDRALYEIGHLIAYSNVTKDGIKPCKVPRDLVQQVIELGSDRDLRPLKGVITAPTMRRDGTIIESTGYDPETKLVVVIPEGVELPPVPDQPTLEEARAALTCLMHPVSEFPLDGPHSRGALLAALLTAVVRPIVRTRPIFGFDAPTRGSGKTKLAEVISTLADTAPPVIQSHLGRDEAETRKRLTAALLEGTSVLIWDNVVGAFDSAKIAALATAEVWGDRVLGESKNAKVVNSLMLTVTGNNLDIRGDMARRMLVCRIDTGLASPISRKFEVEPVSYTREHRLEMVAAALTLMRAAQLDEPPEAPPLASFEEWDALVRRAVLWVIKNIDGEAYGDPVEAVIEAVEENPDAATDAMLLEALKAVFPAKPFTSADIIEKLPSSRYAKAGDKGRRALIAAFEALAGGDGSWNAHSIGKVLAYRRGRICGNLKLVRQGRGSPVRWRVENVDPSTGEKPKRVRRRAKSEPEGVE